MEVEEKMPSSELKKVNVNETKNFTSFSPSHHSTVSHSSFSSSTLLSSSSSSSTSPLSSSLSSSDGVQSAAIVACFMYCFCSLMMTFSNKAILSTYQFQWPMLLLLFQHTFTVVFVKLAQMMNLITVEPLRMSVVKKWLPVNILFIAMLLSGTYSLKFLSVPLVTIFKNFTTMLITFGDFILFSHPVNPGIITSLFLMLFGSVVAALNDLEFNSLGYLWMFVNCVMSAAYVLYMRIAMKGTKLSEFGNVYYNNILSIPLIIPLMLLNGIDSLSEYTYWNDPGFIVTALFGGLSSVGISFASFWTVRTTSPTTYSVVGSLNKIPLTILGVLVFQTPLNFLGKVSIVIGLFGGVVYSFVKHMEWSNQTDKNEKK